MQTVPDLLPATQLFLVVLLHFVWQAALIIGLVAICRSLIHPRLCQLRYILSVTAMATVLVAPLATLGYYHFNPDALQTLSPAIPEAGVSTSSLVTPMQELSWLESEFLEVFHWFDANRLLWLGGWLTGFFFLVVRLCVGLGHSIRIRRSRQPLPGKLNRIAERLKKQFNLTREVIVATSHEVTQAVATGFLKPVVLVPTAWLTSLPVSSLEAILAHELAHIKRWDLWVNLLQRFTETVFFFHPFVWWLSKQISSEREVCCDQLAIGITGQPMRYVETLATVAGTMDRNDFEFQFGNAFVGGKKMNLLRRAKMILEPASMDTRSSFRTLTTIVCVGLLVTCGSYAYCMTPDPVGRTLQEETDDQEILVELHTHVTDDESEGGELAFTWVQDSSDGDATVDVHRHLAQLLLREGKVSNNRELAQKLREIADQLESAGDGTADTLHRKRKVRRALAEIDTGLKEIELHTHDGKRKVRRAPALVEINTDLEVINTDLDEIDTDLEEIEVHTHDGETYRVKIREKSLGNNVELKERIILDPRTRSLLKDGEGNLHVLRVDDLEGAGHTIVVETEGDGKVSGSKQQPGQRGVFRLHRLEDDTDSEDGKKRGKKRMRLHPKTEAGNHAAHAAGLRFIEKAHDAHANQFRFERTSPSDQDLGDVIRELKHEVQQLRNEVNEMRQQGKSSKRRKRGNDGAAKE